MISKDFKCSIQLINRKTHELNNLALKNRCLISISPSSQPTTSTNSNVSSGSIYISNGDLTTEQVKSEMTKKLKKINFCMFIV
jgi:hypothetical protein